MRHKWHPTNVPRPLLISAIEFKYQGVEILTYSIIINSFGRRFPKNNCRTLIGVPRIYSSCLKSLTILGSAIRLRDIMETLILLFLPLIFTMNRNLAIENLALRQQLAIMKRHAKRPKLQTRDRIFWVIVSRLWKDWESSLIVVKPDTVIPVSYTHLTLPTILLV